MKATTPIDYTNHKEDLTELAERIYNIMDPWEREFTVEEIAHDIADGPLMCIKWLLDRIEED